MAERATARIDLAAVSSNCRMLADRLAPASELCAVVKANGYGHGTEAVAAAALEGGAGRLAVATASEAEDVGRRFPGARLLTLGALREEGMRIAVGAGSDVAVWNRDGIEMARACGRMFGRPTPVHVKYDTGMGRLGCSDPGLVAELVDACAADPDIELAGFWTHFATADDSGSDYFDRQLDAFRGVATAVKSRHPGVTAHAANSAAVLREPAAGFDMARCGIAIYGLDPFGRDARARGLLPALSLHSYVGDVKWFEKGTSAGYSRTWAAGQGTWVAVVPIGYGDGVRRSMSNNGDVLIHGKRCPIVGNVSMDNITVELGPSTEVERGDDVTLIGVMGEDEITAEEVARRQGTINYEVTTSISARVHRQSVPAGD